MSETFAQLLEESLAHTQLTPGSVIQGHVDDIGGDYVTLSVGMKSEGIVPVGEFERDEAGNLALQVGDTIDVMLIDPEDVVLSREQAIRAAAWIELEKAETDGAIVTGTITDRVKGGFTVMVHGLRAFLPGSLVDIRPIRDPSFLENKPLDFKIVKMDQRRNNIVVSRRAVIEAETSEERAELLASLAEGQVVSGIVKNLTDYGAFVDLGGIDGLLHITDLSWKRVKHPSDLLAVGDEINVKILSFDKEKNRVSLGLKQMQGDPWVDLTDRYPLQTRVFGTVTNITDYGCFVELEDGIEGLVHMSEMDWTDKNVHPSKVVSVGQEIEVMVLDIDDKRRRISLGMKQCMPNPWTEFEQNYTVGQAVSGDVRSITDFGLFLGLDGDIDGLVHSTDLSWTESGEQALRGYQKGDKVQAVILSIDVDRERISLGIKQTQDDPYQAFLDQHPPGSKLTGTVLSVDSKRAVLDLGDDVQGSLRANECPDGVKVGDSVDAFLVSSERKGQYVHLSDRPDVTPRIKGDTQSSMPDDMGPATLGDLIKEQLARRSDD